MFALHIHFLKYTVCLPQHIIVIQIFITFLVIPLSMEEKIFSHEMYWLVKLIRKTYL